MDGVSWQPDAVDAEELKLHFKRPETVPDKAVDHAACVRNDIAEYQRPSQNKVQQRQDAVIHKEIDNAHCLKFEEVHEAFLVFLKKLFQHHLSPQ